MVPMKKLISVVEFMSMYEAHKEWQESMAAHGTQMILENVLLRELTFSSEFDLSEAIFIECHFQSCRFFDADLFATNFGYSLFENCEFKNNNINKSQIDSSNFNKCRFASVQMIRSDLSDSSFNNCEFEKCDFSKAYMVASRFKDCQISDNCVFEDTNLKEAEFINCIDPRTRYN